MIVGVRLATLNIYMKNLKKMDFLLKNKNVKHIDLFELFFIKKRR